MPRSGSDTQRGAFGRLQQGVQGAVRSNATAFGYSILITTTYGVVDQETGGPSVLRILMFVLGATFGFALWETIASRGFQVRIREERSDVVLVGTALSPLSVALGFVTAVGVLQVLHGAWAWGMAPLAATVVFVAVAGAQLAAARRYTEEHPPSN